MDINSLFSAASLEVVGLVVGGALVAKAMLSTMVRTKQYQSNIVAGFGGQFKRSTRAGLSGKMPWPVETIAKTVSLKDQILDLVINVRTTEKSTIQGATTNNAASSTVADQAVVAASPQLDAQLHYFVGVPVQVKFAVEDPIKAERLIGDDISKPSPRRDFLENRIRNVVTAHFSEKGLHQVYAERSAVAEEVRADLEAQMTGPYGIRISTVTVDNPNMDDRLTNAIKSASEAGLLLAAQRQNAEADRIKRVAAAQAKQAEMEAEANGKRAILTAQAAGEGDIRIKAAEADSQARTLLGKGIANEQTAIFDSLAAAIEKMAPHGITGEQVLAYMHNTNDRVLRRQLGEAYAEAIGKVPNAMFFGGTPTPVLEGGSDSGVPAGLQAVMEQVMAAATAYAKRPAFDGKKPATVAETPAAA